MTRNDGENAEDDPALRLRALEERFARLDRIVRELNPRDRETLDSVLAGELNKQIAIRLGISERAVEMRRATLLRKFGVESAIELIEAAVTHRVLQDVSAVASLPEFATFGAELGSAIRGS